MTVKVKVILIAFILILGYSKSAFDQTKVACIGNSVTYGSGVKPEDAYPSQLAQLLGDSYQVKNFGVNGSTLLRKGHNPFTATENYKKALEFAPDIAIIHLGLNDTDPRNWPAYRDEYTADYYFLINQLRKANPNIKIFISSLTPIFSGHPRFKSGTHTWHSQIQEKIKEISLDTTLNFIDLNSVLKNRPDLFPDNLHPNEIGYALIAKAIYKKIAPTETPLGVSSAIMDNMVLQRNRQITLKGSSKPLSSIKLTIGDVMLKGETDPFGDWQINIPPQKEGGPYSLRIESNGESLIKNNLYFGDVWLISGQSNMEFPLKESLPKLDTQSLQNTLPKFNILHLKGRARTKDMAWSSEQLDSTDDLQYFEGIWKRASYPEIQEMSAVGYYFTDHLLKNTNIPIGIIQVSVGGSGIESWVDRGTLESHPLLVDMMDNWRKSDFIMPWVRERADKNLANASHPKARHPFEPAFNFEAGIRKLEGLPIAGVLWYQGESNAHNPEVYSVLFTQWIKSWRKYFKDSALPFYYVQLSSLNRPEWPVFRNTQRVLSKAEEHIYMVSSIDVGDSLDVHPRYKQPIGLRLAERILSNSYFKKQEIPFNFVVKYSKSKNTLHLDFAEHTEISTTDGKPIYGFEVLSKKGERIPVKARVIGDKIQIDLPEGEKEFTSLRYGWEAFTRANVLLKNLHPLPTFEQELTDGVTVYF